MNSCSFIGRLVNDTTVRRDKSGDKILVTCYFNLAVERITRFTKQKYDVFSMKASGAIAETCEKWLKKGKKIGCLAKAEHNKYQKAGKWYEHVVFHISELYFIDEKGDLVANEVSDKVNEIPLDTSELEETEYKGVDFNALD